MPPNLDDKHLKRPSSELIMCMTPLPLTGPLSDDDTDEEPIPSDPEDDYVADYNRVVVPLDCNIQALLVQVAGTEDLASVTQLKLRVIARDVPLQHLSFHIPALRELILDGSVISSLRDLGNGLKSLKVLKVNRCGLESLDNMLGLQCLEELYASDNSIDDCTSCAFLLNVKVLDLRRNRLRHIARTLTFLTICEKLERIYLEGNDEISQFPAYRQTVKSLLPTLRSLDGITYAEDELDAEYSLKAESRTSKVKSPQTDAAKTIHTVRAGSGQVVQCGFTIRFPPKVCMDKAGSPTTNK